MLGPVLVVDDNAINLKLFRDLLAGEGYEVRTASNAGECMASIAEACPRLILMDLQMPGVDGFELAKRLKTDPKTAGIAIVAFTSYAMKGDRERAIVAGCDGYLAKPIDTRALPKMIADYLQR